MLKEQVKRIEESLTMTAPKRYKRIMVIDDSEGEKIFSVAFVNKLM